MNIRLRNPKIVSSDVPTGSNIAHPTLLKTRAIVMKTKTFVSFTKKPLIP